MNWLFGIVEEIGAAAVAVSPKYITVGMTALGACGCVRVVALGVLV